MGKYQSICNSLLMLCSQSNSIFFIFFFFFFLLRYLNFQCLSPAWLGAMVSPSICISPSLISLSGFVPVLGAELSEGLSPALPWPQLSQQFPDGACRQSRDSWPANTKISIPIRPKDQHFGRFPCSPLTCKSNHTCPPFLC